MAGRSNWTSCRVSGPVSRYWSQLSQYTGPKRTTVSRLGPGEVARVSVVSLKVDLANVVFNHIVGTCRRSLSSALSPWLSNLVQTLFCYAILRAKHVEIWVVAGTRAEPALLPRWSAGCIFDRVHPYAPGQRTESSNYEFRARSLADSSRCPRLRPLAPLGRLPAQLTLASSNTGGKAWASHGGQGARLGNEPSLLDARRCQKLKRATRTFTTTDCAAEFSSAGDAYYGRRGCQVHASCGPRVARQGGRLFAAMDRHRAVMAGPLPLHTPRWQQAGCRLGLRVAG